MPAMWDHYRRMLFPTQAFILLACLVGYAWGQLSLNKVLPAFVLMQAAAVLGAWWAARIKRQVEADDRRLPLEADDKRLPFE
jgi:hypothetical protein